MSFLLCPGSLEESNAMIQKAEGQELVEKDRGQSNEIKLCVAEIGTKASVVGRDFRIENWGWGKIGADLKNKLVL